MIYERLFLTQLIRRAVCKQRKHKNQLIRDVLLIVFTDSLIADIFYKRENSQYRNGVCQFADKALNADVNVKND